MSTELMTLEEQEAILEEAIELIKEPASWTTGQWKCPLYATDKKGNVLYDSEGNPEPARDLYNRPLSQHCVEGAVNQAVYNQLGEERAVALGAYNSLSGSEDGKFAGNDSEIWPTDLLEIDKLAREREPEICAGESHAALQLNDYYDDDYVTGHKKILGLLKARRTQIRKALGKKSPV